VEDPELHFLQQEASTASPTTEEDPQAAALELNFLHKAPWISKKNVY